MIESNSDELTPAIKLRDAGEYQEAQEWLQKFTESQPNHAEAFSLLCHVLLLNKKDAEAERSLLRATSINSELASIYRNQSRLLLKQSKPEDALKKAQIGYERSVNNLESGLVLAACLNANQRSQEALDLIEKILQSNPNYAEAYATRALIRLRSNDIIGAIADSERAVLLKPHLTEIWVLLGSIHHRNKNLTGAIKAMEKAHELEPTYVNYMSDLGEFFRQDSRNLEAISILEKAYKLAPKNINVLINLGTAFQQNEDFDKAKAVYEKALVINPKSAEISNNLAAIAKSTGDLVSAQRYFESALEVKPDIAETHFNLGTTLRDLDRLEEAEESYRIAIGLKSDFSEAHYNLGITSQALGRLEHAESSYRRAIALRPDYAEAHSNLGIILQESGRLKDAEASYRTAIALRPDFAENHHNLGATLQELGRLEEAEAAYEQTIALKFDFYEAHYNLGLTLHQLGKLEKAIKACNNALSIKPASYRVWNSIAFPLQAIKTKISPNDNLLSLCREDTKSKPAQIEKSILSYKLELGGKKAGDSLSEAISLLAKAGNMAIKNPGEKIVGRLDLKLPDKVIAMMHFGRSGTGLLHSLIDGHSEVSTLPSVYLSQYFFHSNWEKIIAGGWDEMVDRFVAIYEVLFNSASTVPIETHGKALLYDFGKNEGLTNVGDNQNEILTIDKKQFCEEMNRLMCLYDELDAFIFFKLVHAAYDKAINDLHKKNLLFYHIHNPDVYAQLNFLRLAPDFRGLIMVREPIQSCESWLRDVFINNNYAQVSRRISTMLFEINSIVYHKCDSIGLRLEDIKERPRQTISELCKWMGIEEAESLYEMTVQGKKWWGDPSSQDFKTDGMNPFGKTSINREIGSVFSEKDQFILRTLYYPFSVRFGYAQENFEKFKSDLQAIRPMLDQMFDFEKALAKRTQIDQKRFMSSGPYLYLRSGLIERWNTLNEFHTYPNMIEPLKIVSN